MASAVAELPAPDKPAGPSVVKWLAGLVLLTLLAAGAGGFLGFRFLAPASSDPKAEKAHSEPAPPPSKESNMRELAPIITNLAEPADVWVRLQVAIVFDAKAVPKPDVLAAQISEDLLGFLRTLTIGQIGGASGLEHLREDLNERAQIRSEGRVSNLFIENLVVQ